MLFHMSFAADDPQATAQLMAEIWQGRAYPFPPFAEGSWIAMAGDDRGSGLEVYPRGTEMHEGEGTRDVRCVMGATNRNIANHAAIATALSQEEVKAIADRYGVAAKPCDRGPFRVIELWVDGCTMFEVLTPDMQDEYRAAMTFEGWEGFLAATAGKASHHNN
jgi:hypothetical protein